MNEIVPFVFKHDEDEMPIRTVLIDGEPWFVAVDPCRALGLEQTSAAVRPLDADEKGVTTVTTLGGPQEMNIISEPGLYKLIQGSRKPAAKTFDRFVRHEILPAIRRTGRYELGSTASEPDLLTAINGVETRLVARLERIEGKLDGGRQGFSIDTVRYVCEGVAKYNNGECIYCNNVSVVTKFGEKITYELHHANGNKADNSAENCTIPCPDCHKRLTNKKRKDHIPVHEALGIANAFHRKLKQKAGQIRPPAVATMGFWDFRAASQVDMGFPQLAKRER